MRSDFLYEQDDPQRDGIWCIYPEFEGKDRSILQPDVKIPNSGTATMWILY